MLCNFDLSNFLGVTEVFLNKVVYLKDMKC